MNIRRIIDVRNTPPRERYASILDTLETLRDGETMELINDHDPTAMWDEIRERIPGVFDIHYVKRGPQEWKIDIKKLPVYRPEQPLNNPYEAPPIH